MKSALLAKGDKSSEISADIAQTKNERRAWCPDCSGAVHLMRKLKPRSVAHFEHYNHAEAEQAGCKLIEPYR